MSILVIGDLHFKHDNEIESDILLNDILEVITLKDVDFVVVLGDIMHNHEKIDMRVFGRVEVFIEKISSLKPLYILIGNHDRPNNKVYLTEEHMFNPFKRWNNVFIIDTAYQMEWKDKRICFMPFVPDGMFIRGLSDCNINIEETDLFFSHSEFVGCSINKFSKNKCDVWKPEYPLNIAGHIHDFEVVASNLIYVGTPYQSTFSEKTDKGIFLLDENLQLEMIQITVPKKIHKKINFKDIDSIEVNPDEKLKLTIDGPVAQVKEILNNPSNIDKFRDVKILFNDSNKERKKIQNFNSNMSFIDRLYSELNKNPEMGQIFSIAFQNNNK